MSPKNSSPDSISQRLSSVPEEAKKLSEEKLTGMQQMGLLRSTEDPFIVLITKLSVRTLSKNSVTPHIGTGPVYTLSFL